MFTTRIELEIEIVQKKTSPALQNTFKMRVLTKLFRKTSALIEENPIELQTNNFMRVGVEIKFR